MAMNYSNRENVIEICSILAQEKNLTATIHESGKGALVVGMGVFTGGILGGPVGMAVGGIVTSLVTAYSAKGKFKSVVEIIAEMNDDQRRRLSEAVMRAIRNIRPEDYVQAISLVLTSASLKEVVLKELGSFLMKEMHAQIR